MTPALATLTRTDTAPFIAGDRIIRRGNPDAGRMTVLWCEMTPRGWSVHWRADPVTKGVSAAVGFCPADRVVPASQEWAERLGRPVVGGGI